MKIYAHVGKEIEVDISSEQLVEAINNLPQPEHSITLFNVINYFANALNHINDDQINGLTKDQRKIVGEYLEQQSKRYLPAGGTRH